MMLPPLKAAPSLTDSPQAPEAPDRAAAPPGAPPCAAAAASLGASAVLLLLDVAPSSRLWGYARFVLGPRVLRAVPGLRGAKVLGSGFEGGFGLRPSGSMQGLFCFFEHDDHAREFLDRSPVVRAYRDHAREFFSVRLRPFASRGSWAGGTLTPDVPAPPSGPVAALTRASIRPVKAKEFWSMAPAAQASLAQAPGCRLAAGLGEAPLVRQATFSIWDDAAAMDAYARSGAHLAAIRASMQRHFFSESMFVRFLAEDARGVYQGRRHG